MTWLSASGSARPSADGGFSASLTEHAPFGPSGSFSATGTPISTDNEVGEVLKATGSFNNTPLGPVDFLTASGRATIATDGAFSASMCSAHTPGASEGLSLTGTIGGGVPEITGGSINLDGFKFSF